MEEKGVSGPFIVISEENCDRLYPMFIGVSCALFALRLLPESEICDEKWSEIRNKMLKGSALVGLLGWTVQRNVVTTEKSKLLEKLEIAQVEIAELKKRRSEDAKANEKVVSIFATREQSWFDERRKLSHQIAYLRNDLRVVEAKREISVSELGDKMKDIEVILQLKDKMIEEAERRRLESEEKLKAAQDLVEELRENVKSEVERHFSEISKHKTAFIELVSNQRQLEAEMGRTIRQVEAAKQELEAVLGQKEQLDLVNQRLSVEIVRLHKDFERRYNLDAAEKQMLLKEVRSSKVKRKQAEVEAEKWKAVAESKHDRISLRSIFFNGKSEGKSLRGNATTPLDAWDHRSEIRKGVEVLSFVTQESRAEQKHNVEIYGFMEQLRQKDEKLEAYNWRLMNTELESRRLQSHIEALDHDIAQLKKDNARLEGTLSDREAKLQEERLMTRFMPANAQKLDAALVDDTVWSRVKVVRRKPGYTGQETMMENDYKVDEASENELQDTVLALEKPNKDHIREERVKSSSDCTWKMDVHALGVSYKVRRLKQQLSVLERLAGKETCENGEDNKRVKGIYALLLLLNKQVERYHLLQGKIDQLCKRMKENKVNSKCGEDGIKRMEHFLEETFQLQRYIVATGQKVMEVQSMIASNLVAEEEDMEKHGSFEIERFGDSLKTLFRETQRGLEVRISRIIGDLEGTLARDGFNTWRRF